MKIAVICPSDIAERRFMPALMKCDFFQFAGVGYASAEERNEEISEKTKIKVELQKERAEHFAKQYNGKLLGTYSDVVNDPNIEAVYIPLPPALHYRWAKMALQRGKHVFVEKPSTVSEENTTDLVKIAREQHLALHENYMFIYHRQIMRIKQLIDSGVIGDVRLYRLSFGFPLRAQNDFRYKKSLGGGALLDAGGYTLKYASLLLGNTAHVTDAHLGYLKEYEVDMYGSGTVANDYGQVAQISFGMDNNYKCEVEVWGSKGCIHTNRIFTAPAGLDITIDVQNGNEIRTEKIDADDTFQKSIDAFREDITNSETREKDYNAIMKQSELVDEFRKIALKKD